MRIGTDQRDDLNVSGAIFDLDGTLIDNVFHLTIAWQTALRDLGFSVSCSDVRPRIGLEISEFVHDLTGLRISDRQSGKLKAVKNESFKSLEAQVTCVAGADELLRGLREAGIPWAIATNRAAASLREVAEPLGLTLDDIVVTAEAGRAKPAPDLVETALSKMGVERSGVVMVGDSLVDVAAAAAAGIESIGVLTGAGTRRSLIDAGALNVVDSVGSFEVHGDSIIVHRPEDEDLSACPSRPGVKYEKLDEKG